MGESDVTTLTLEQSVSFGKFENDSLSWEKWSSFSPNKYLDEVEKFSTPGSVKEKKAYFEAHYKKVAARKAELEQDNPVQCAPARSELKHENHIEFDVVEAEKSSVKAEQIAQQKAYFDELYKKIADRMDEQVEQDTQTNDTENPRVEVDQFAHKKAYFEAQLKNVDGSRTERLNQDKSLSSGYRDLDEVENKNLTESPHASDCTLNVCVREKVSKQVDEEEVVDIEVEDAIGNGSRENLEISDGECLTPSIEEDKEITLVITEELPCLVNTPDTLKFDKKVENREKTAPRKEAKNLNVKKRNIPAKKVSAEKEKPLTGTKKKVVPSAPKSSLVSSSRSSKQAPSSNLTGTKKKSVSSATKSSPISTPRPSKLSVASPVTSASKSSSKKLNTTAMSVNKRAGPTSLHMSLNLGSPNLSVEPASARKSLIMETMADKDIIKRAFSAFKNNFQELRSSHDEKSIRASQASEVLEREVTTPPRKDNAGSRKGADKRTPTRGRLGIFSPVTPGRVLSHEENKRGKAFSTSVVSESDVGAEKQKDFPKKLGQKSTTKEVAKVQIPTKSKGKNGVVAMSKKKSEASKLTGR